MNIHERGKDIASRRHRSDIDLIDILIELGETKAYKELEHPSLQIYAEKEFRLTRDTARSLIRIANKSIELSELKQAISSERVTVSKCEKVASQLTKENVAEVMEYLEKHSLEKTLNWLGKNEERKAVLKIALRILDKVHHAQSLLKEQLDVEATIELALDELIERRDPVRKAERAEKRQTKCGISRTPMSKPRKRQYPAALRHALNRRDKKQCRHHDHVGERCENKKYTDFHHIIEVINGGEDTLENLLTLCTAHHKMVHEKQIPKSAQREWQRL